MHCKITAVAACFIALSQFLATFVAVLIIDKFGRRILLIISDLFMSVSLVALGVYFYMDENKYTHCELGNVTNSLPSPVSIYVVSRYLCAKMRVSAQFIFY